MKQYVIDQLRREDHRQVKTYLDAHFHGSGMEGLYWIPVDPGHYSPVQAEHTDCQPYFFAVELTEDKISCELLVRTRQRVRCGCIAYATRDQRNWLIDCMDAILEKLGISI